MKSVIAAMGVANARAMSSTPTFSDFDPSVIPYQLKVIKDVKRNYDYSLGTHEVLLSGSVGSAKSILMAHLAVSHCIENRNARFMLGRKAMPDLKSTIFQKVLEHMQDTFTAGVDYTVNQTSASIKFLRNGSEIISRSWSDKHYFKMRSLELSGAAIEETTENDTQDFYNEIKMRVGRLPHVPENIIINATNPSDPGHWAYDYFIETKKPTRHVYYSVTTDNPFLPSSYIDQLRSDLDPKLARRMIYGEWVEITKEVVYHAYSKENNYREEDYQVNPNEPIFITWDFNIGEGKPLSLCMFQFVADRMHIFNEVVVEGMRTEDSCEELASRGLLNYPNKYVITGDATGKARSTQSIRSNYEIIENYFANYRRVRYEVDVPLSNGSVRNRHNLVNAYCQNANGETRLFVYKNAKMADKGLRLTQLKPGGRYVEDDSKEYQHITTAIGYGLATALRHKTKKKQGTVRF